MKLYKISQTENTGYDTYDSAVVAAESEEEAKTIHPAAEYPWNERDYSWASSSKNVTAEYLGETHLPKGVIVASFNAG